MRVVSVPADVTKGSKKFFFFLVREKFQAQSLLVHVLWQEGGDEALKVKKINK